MEAFFPLKICSLKWIEGEPPEAIVARLDSQSPEMRRVSSFDDRIVYEGKLLAQNPWTVWARVSLDARDALTTVHADLEVDLLPAFLMVALPWLLKPSLAIGLAADSAILAAGVLTTWRGVRHIRSRLHRRTEKRSSETR